MGEKAVKAVVDGAPAEDATAKDLQCYQYLLWQESVKLKEQERVLAERKKQTSLKRAPGGSIRPILRTVPTPS